MLPRVFHSTTQRVVQLWLLFAFLQRTRQVIRCSGYVVAPSRHVLSKSYSSVIVPDVRLRRIKVDFCAESNIPFRGLTVNADEPFHLGAETCLLGQEGRSRMRDEDTFHFHAGEGEDDQGFSEVVNKSLHADQQSTEATTSLSNRTLQTGLSKVDQSATNSCIGGTFTRQTIDTLRKQSTLGSLTTKMHVKKMNNGSLHIGQAVIQSAIEDLIALKEPKFSQRFHSLGIKMDVEKEASVESGVAIRLANKNDDVDIATLRLSVFSDFTPDIQNQFCVRSCQAIAARRLRGATCFVAITTCHSGCIEYGRSDRVVGSAECSFHEFTGTLLGRRRPASSILYVTEVAVSPHVRRQRIGSKLLNTISSFARNEGFETLYLHCDVENEGALKLYEKAGFQKIITDDPMYYEFTKSLNLQPGATKGREHYLLYKNVTSGQTWLNDTRLIGEDHTNELMCMLGFEIHA